MVKQHLTKKKCGLWGKNVEFPLIENMFSEFFEKLKVSEFYRKSENSDYKEKSENFYNP